MDLLWYFVPNINFLWKLWTLFLLRVFHCFLELLVGHLDTLSSVQICDDNYIVEYSSCLNLFDFSDSISTFLDVFVTRFFSWLWVDKLKKQIVCLLISSFGKGQTQVIFVLKHHSITPNEESSEQKLREDELWLMRQRTIIRCSCSIEDKLGALLVLFHILIY